MKRYSFQSVAISCAVTVVAMSISACGGSESGTIAATTSTPPPPVPPPPPPTPSTKYVDYRSIPQQVLFTDERPTFTLEHDAAFPDVVVWGQAVTLSALQSTTQAASVEIDYMRIIEKDKFTGVETVVATTIFPQMEGQPLRCDFLGNEVDTGFCVGANYKRYCPEKSELCWYQDQNLAGGKTQIKNSKIENGVLTIDLAKEPLKVAHWWTTANTPSSRARSRAGYFYFAEARFRVTGSAAINFGADRWRNPEGSPLGCILEEADQPSCNNKQSWYSIWVGDTKGQFLVGRFPLRFSA